MTRRSNGPSLEASTPPGDEALPSTGLKSLVSETVVDVHPKPKRSRTARKRKVFFIEFGYAQEYTKICYTTCV